MSVLDAAMAEAPEKSGLTSMEAGQRAVLGGSVPRPLLVTRSLIEGSKGWGLRTLESIPAVFCVIVYHGEYITQEEADEAGAAAHGKAAKACFRSPWRPARCAPWCAPPTSSPLSIPAAATPVAT